ncbi:MAG: SUMF1/EgtB/PvdO family nonheme iron enzyme [Anaerolineae bacterium]|nr:SUMF1/EgtB/PvdO family nonheme iron enzyme [Anaerolineae bacterium]
MGQSYGRLGSGGRRNTAAVWQWLIIGGIFGMFCTAILFFTLLIFGFVGIDPTGSGRIGATQTAVVQIVTATPDLNAPTITPVIVTATPEPTTPSPTLDSNNALTFATPTIPVTITSTTEAAAPTEEVTVPTAQAGDPVTANTAVEIPPQLVGIGSSMVRVDGGTFTMGTTPQEVAEAVRICVERDQANCVTSFGDDSVPQFDVTVDAFQIERTEVSLRQYVAFLNYLQSTGRNHLNGCGTDGIPRQCVATQQEQSFSLIFYDSANYEVRPDFLADNAAVYVTWYGADAYCRALGRRH